MFAINITVSVVFYFTDSFPLALNNFYSKCWDGNLVSSPPSEWTTTFIIIIRQNLTLFDKIRYRDPFCLVVGGGGLNKYIYFTTNVPLINISVLFLR